MNSLSAEEEFSENLQEGRLAQLGERPRSSATYFFGFGLASLRFLRHEPSLFRSRG